MAATQTRLRRGTAAQIDAMTPAADELISETTAKRLRIGDGLQAGGIHIPNFLDIRGSVFIGGSVGGTGNAITLTLNPALAAYNSYVHLRFIASANNTGAVTINVNGLGARNIRKVSGGAIVALTSGDLIAGAPYEIVYSSSQFVLTNFSSQGITSVSQGDLNTSSGTVSTTSQAHLTLPGGEYGFYPRIRISSSGAAGYALNHGRADATNGPITPYTSLSTSYVARISLGQQGNLGAPTISAQQRYVTSSPPYDMGDGEVAGFFYALVNANGEIDSTYIADAPPWAYNGPTDIRATHKCLATGKKFRRVIQKRNLEEILDGAAVKYKLQEITQAVKNADMNLVPHPFSDFGNDKRVVLLDPMDNKIRKLIEYQNAGGNDIEDMLAAGRFQVDNSECKRKCPKGIRVHKMKFKYTKKF